MSAPALTAADTMLCPHGGTVVATPAAGNVTAGAAVLTESDMFVIAGCAFAIGVAPSPCVTVQWTAPAGQVRRGGAPVLTAASIGLCLAATQAPQGTVIVSPAQIRARAA